MAYLLLPTSDCPCISDNYLYILDDYLCISDNYLYILDDCLCISDNYLYILDDYLCISDNYLYILDDYLFISDNYLYILDDYLCISDDCLFISDDYLCISDDCLIISDDYLCISDDCLFISDDYLCISDDCLIFSDDYLFISDDYLFISDDSSLDKMEQTLKHSDYFDVRKLVNVESLFKKRVHFGHHRGCRDPYMTPYIFGSRLEMDIIDLDQTLPLLQDALNFVSHMAYRDGIILLVSKNRIIMPEVEKTAMRVKEYAHCRHWHEGLFTNSNRVFKTTARLPDLCIFLNTLDNVFEMHRGITECAKLLIPTVGIVDTNCDPRLISYPVPGNDDTVDSLMYYLKLFEKAIVLGKKKRFQDGLVDEDFDVTEAVVKTAEMKETLNDVENEVSKNEEELTKDGEELTKDGNAE